MRLPLAALVLALPAAALAAPAPAGPHPFSVHDLVAFDRLSEPAVSPDGKHVVFTQSVLDLDANRRRKDLWMVNIDGSALRRLTAHEGDDAGAAWSADGKWIYFMSTRSGSAQVWRIAPDGGEAQPVTRIALDVEAFLLSPDGTRLVVALEVFPDCAKVECTRKRLDEHGKKKTSGMLFDQLLFRHWDAWSDGRRLHLFALPVAGGEPVDLMKGMLADAPSRPFGGTDEFAFTPDGKSVVFAARDAGREEAWSTNFDLFVASIDGAAKPRNLTAANPAWDTGPVFSPDGKTLAYRAMSRPGYEADRFKIMLRAWPDGEPRAIAGAWDRSPDSLVFSPDGKTLYTTADDLGNRTLFAIDVASGEARALLRNGHVSDPAAAGDRVVFLLDHLRSPAELHSVRPDGTELAAITSVNREKLAKVQLGEPEQFTFKGAGDEVVHGWVVRPASFDASKKYPVALLIHGGPQGSFGNHFHYRWNPQTYAGAGYVSVMVDFHGSTGYGQAFTDAIGGDWGGKPLIDLQKGLAAAIDKYKFIDGDRACALGASYGGYMINWIAGNWPDRFRCLVSHDGNLDERMAYFDTEELWFPEWDHKGTPWDNPESYARHNPIEHVKKWKTPMLVIHGGKDYRVVDVQGMAAFTALQRRGIPSKLLYFPDENHWVLRPHNSILWHQTVLDWLGQWSKKPAAK